MIRKEPPHSEDLLYRASSSSTSPHVGDNQDGTDRSKGSDYEVFLNFRGKDTRKGFADYLYTNLINAGIRVYRDSNELHVGKEIGPELLCSIMQSKISIPIISEDYASSEWCLQELTQMLKCMRSKGQVVLPIFYKVKPSQVRDPKGKFGDAINAHKNNLGQVVVKEWEEALNEVSSLKGWESEKIADGHEAALVKMVVIRVMSEIKKNFHLTVPKQLVATDDRVEQIMSKIDANFNGTWIIGIYGMGGIGKTTLAKVLYNKLFSNFEDRSFLANIREKSQREGIECLQKQLIFDVIKDSSGLSNVDEGIRVLKSQCTNKKVLALLDDMDDNTHLDALVGDGSWFKAGSIVIITTRNKSILDYARASHLYELEELPPNQSLILFSRHAFRTDFPPSNYEHISHVAVSITGGLPLALEVIGSYLCGKTKETWKDALKKLEKIPAQEVQKRLRISYDTLDYEEQQIFLDIACFFIGSSKQNPIYMWDACGFYPEIGIEVLSLMSLIKIGKNGTLLMHDQLRDLGRDIVRLQGPNIPRRRSRIWSDEEAEHALESNKGTCEIEALRLGYYRWKSYDKKSYRGELFNELTNLRFLQMGNVNFTGNFPNLLHQLRWLEWRYCPSDFEVTNFHPKELVVLNLSNSEISEDWGGWGPFKMATNLKVLDLSYSANLRTTPDLSAFKSLEILNLENCTSLEEIHSSIWYIKTLVSLNVHRCSKLEKLPARVGRMEESRELLCYDKLAQLPESIGSFELLTKLDLSFTRIKELPESIGSMKALETLNGHCCELLDCIPNSIGNLASLSLLQLCYCTSLTEIPDSIGKLASLIGLNLSWTSIIKLPESIGNLQNLRSLYLNKAPVMELPSAIGMLTKLQVLSAMGCKGLIGLPSSIGELVSLNDLCLEESGIWGLPESIMKLSSLQRLNVWNCKNLREIPEPPSSLTTLRVDFPTPSLPYLSKLTLLKELSLFDLRPLECLSELPVQLSKLHIKCRLLPDAEWMDLEKRLCKLIRDKSSGLREVTGSCWKSIDFFSYQIDEATNPTIAKSSEEGDPLSLSLSLSRPYKFRRPNPTIAKSSEEGDPLSLSLSLSLAELVKTLAEGSFWRQSTKTHGQRKAVMLLDLWRSGSPKLIRFFQANHQA